MENDDTLQFEVLPFLFGHTPFLAGSRLWLVLHDFLVSAALQDVFENFYKQHLSRRLLTGRLAVDKLGTIFLGQIHVSYHVGCPLYMCILMTSYDI